MLDEQSCLTDIVYGCLQELMKTELDHYINAQQYERSGERRAVFNGCYTLMLQTRIGTMELTICRNRQGECQTEFIKRHQRSDQAFIASIIEMH